jgi:hypothetical protein
LPARSRRTDWDFDAFDDDEEYGVLAEPDAAEYDIDFRRPPRKAGRPKRADRSRATQPDDELDLEIEDDERSVALERKEREKRRAGIAGISEPFKCRNCRAFIGEPPSGGRQRNHCPLCLYSLHVDDKTPGDRASDCRSLMAPIGVFYRRNLEQVLVHRCLGCDTVRYNRIAADDNPILLVELPVVEPDEIGGAGVETA